MAEGLNSVGITTVSDTSAIVSVRSLPAESDAGATSAVTEETTDNNRGRRDNDTVNVPEDNGAEPMLSNYTAEGERATSSDVVISASSDLGTITLPPHIRKRGSPEGSELNVVGLPKKRLKLYRRPVPFCQLETSIKDKLILKWFVDDAVAERCTISEEKLITEEEVIETCIDCIEKYFEPDALVALLHVLDSVKLMSITCKVCNEELDTRCVCCELCLGLFHYHCSPISDTPKTKLWFCTECST
ncbi:hypothetical protein DPMN_061000 [Dreissena polymorpha]|uniref:PHD-type domain-containing protein n=1 Tax=Dreissena polymorpha TaxID=45954 RepID=A0A9D4C6Y1_DREPO|nr:hypothetical protein DPMN_061000 [Dreissena polymorpha]